MRSPADVWSAPRACGIANVSGCARRSSASVKNAVPTKSAPEHGSRLASEDLDVPQPVARERREERRGDESEGQKRERREDRDRPAEEARDEVQDHDGKESDGGPEEEEADLFFREEVRRPAGHEEEAGRGERGSRRHPDDLRAVQGRDRVGRVRERPEVNAGGRHEESGRGGEGEPRWERAARGAGT